MRQDHIVDIINKALDSQEAFLGVPIDRSLGAHTPIFGGAGPLDSMGLVSLIVQVEEALEEKYGVSLILASERAMSANRSPFATISSLASYIDELMKEVENV